VELRNHRPRLAEGPKGQSEGGSNGALIATGFVSSPSSIEVCRACVRRSAALLTNATRPSGCGILRSTIGSWLPLGQQVIELTSLVDKALGQVYTAAQAQIARRELTYLSIVDTIKAVEASGALVHYEPTIVRANHSDGPRALWLTPDCKNWCFPTGPHPDIRIGQDQLAPLRVQLNLFVWGEFMEYDFDVKRLLPDEQDIWTIRSYGSTPQLRLFGWFALPKLFVGSHIVVRDDLEDVDGPKWRAAIAIAAGLRKELVGRVEWYNEDPEQYLQNPEA
jgi:hypothetical protein